MDALCDGTCTVPDLDVELKIQENEVDSEGDGVADMSVGLPDDADPPAPGEADSDGDGAADMSVPAADGGETGGAGEADSDGDGAADI